jgi:hypothetical protein
MAISSLFADKADIGLSEPATQNLPFIHQAGALK